MCYFPSCNKGLQRRTCSKLQGKIIELKPKSSDFMVVRCKGIELSLNFYPKKSIDFSGTPILVPTFSPEMLREVFCLKTFSFFNDKIKCIARIKRANVNKNMKFLNLHALVHENRSNSMPLHHSVLYALV